jgi:signal transduction histidine kinase
VEGKNAISLIRKFIHLSDIPRVTKSVIETLSGKNSPTEFFIDTTNMGRVVVESRTFNIEIHGERQIIAVLKNITERKKAEEEILLKNTVLKAQSETATSGILVVDDKGNTLFYNSIFAKIWGIPQKILDTRNDKKMIEYILDRLEDPEKFVSSVKYLYTYKNKKSNDELRFKDGRILDRYSSPMINENGKYYGRVWYFRDVTEQKKAEELIKNYNTKLESEVNARTKELVEEERKVETLSSMKDEFIRNISHELRTPLSVVIGNLKLLRDSAPIGKEREWAKSLDMLDRNTERMTNSINKILEINELSIMTPKKERIYLNDIIGEVYRDQLPITSKKGLKMELHTEPVVIVGDGTLIKIAFMNLVSNAVKFTNKGKINIELKAFDGTVSMKVTDTGIGISSENQKRIYDKFFKANPSAPGAGVGLTITKDIVEKHNGKIKISSKPGKGSVFEILLPRGNELKNKEMRKLEKKS